MWSLIKNCFTEEYGQYYGQMNTNGRMMTVKRDGLPYEEMGYCPPPNRTLPPVPGQHSNYNTIDRIKNGNYYLSASCMNEIGMNEYYIHIKKLNLYSNPHTGKFLYRGKGMVWLVHLSNKYELVWFWNMKLLFLFSNTQYYSWLTTAQAVTSPSSCIYISLPHINIFQSVTIFTHSKLL